MLHFSIILNEMERVIRIAGNEKRFSIHMFNKYNVNILLTLEKIPITSFKLRAMNISRHLLLVRIKHIKCFPSCIG